MSPIEKQLQLGRDLLELNTQWIGKIAEFDGENLKNYVEMNQSFAQRLPEVSDVSTFVELQREYAETLWNGAREAFGTRNELVRGAFEANGELVKTAWSNDTAEAPAEPKAEVKKTKKSKTEDEVKAA